MPVRRSPSALVALQRLAGNRAATIVARQTGEAAAAERAALLVGVGEETAAGQLTTEEFFHRLRPRLEAAVEESLAGTVYTVAGCPWVDHWITYYQTRPASHVERMIQLWAPRAAGARGADELIEAVCERVRDGVAGWRSSGEVPSRPPVDLPDDPAAEPRPAAPPPAPAVQLTAAADLVVGPRLLGAGRRLDSGVSSRLGAPPGVRVHTDPASAGLAARAGARALTVGNDIVFADGAFAPGTTIGDALIAHELAHVSQQREAPRPDGPLPEDQLRDHQELEQDAELSAAYTMLRIEQPTLGRDPGPRLRSGIRVARCSGPTPARDLRPEYDASVTALRALYARKQAVVDGAEPAAALPEIDAGIADEIAVLHELGITLSAGQIYTALTADQPIDLLQVRGRVVRSPDSEAFLGQRMQFHAAMDYLPSNRAVHYEWRWRSGGSQEFRFLEAGSRSRSPELTLGEAFWNLIDDDIRRNRQLEVISRVYLGDDDHATATMSTGSIPLTDRAPGTLDLTADPPAVVQGESVSVRPAEWVPPRSTHSIDWQVGGQDVAADLPVLRHTFATPGSRQVTARLYRVERSFGIRNRELLQTVSTTVRVENPSAAGAAVLDAATAEPGRLPELSTVTTSIEESIAELERRVARGGDHAVYWRERLDAQRARIARLREQAPGADRTQAIPSDEGALDRAVVYSSPMPAAIVVPSGGGAQPLSVHVVLRHEGSVWTARLIDSTSADVVHFDGEAASPAGAQRVAVESWRADHPYPRGGRVAYRGVGFAPGGEFPTTTAWNTAKAWVDGILTVGGVVVAGILLLTPEPTTATKWLGGIILAASVGRSAVAIYENVTIGIPPTDSRNVLEALSIVTSLVGVGGSALRGLGISAVRPTMYRAGNYLVMTALAGDVGTLAFATESGLARLRAAQSDPTLDEGQQAMATLRVISNLMLSGAMFFVSNRDLVRQGIRRSDFLPTDAAAVSRGARGARVELEPGARLDVAAELRAAGEPLVGARVRSGQLSDRELVDRHGSLPWMREQLAPGQVSDILLQLETNALVALQDVGAAQAHRAAVLMEDFGAVNVLAPSLRGAGLASVAAGRAATGSTIVVCPTDRTMVRINGELDIHPRRLAEIPERGRNDIMRAYRALQAAGGRADRMSADDRLLLDQVTGSSRGYRLRSEYHRARANRLLDDLGITALPSEQRRIFENMSDSDRDRLFDLVSDRPPGTATDIRHQATAYALPRADSVRSFVEHYQVYTTDFMARARSRIAAYQGRLDTAIAEATAASGRDLTARETQAVQNRVKGELGITGNAEKFYYERVMHEMAGGRPGAAVDTRRPSDAATAEVAAAYDRRVAALDGRVGGVSVAPGLSNDDLVAALRQHPDITFGSESAAVYHVVKHYDELPAALRAAGEGAGRPDVAIYLDSAHVTVTSGAASITTSQDGTARSVRFVHDGMVAIVRVDTDGRAVLATHMGGR